MTIRWGLVTLGLLVACAAPAQNQGQISVTVGQDGTVTVSPSEYHFTGANRSVTVALGTRGYTITAVTVEGTSAKINCQPSTSSTWVCVSTAGADAKKKYPYKVTVSNGQPVTSGSNVFIQDE